MKKRYLVAGVTAVLVAGVGLTSLMTGKSPMLLVRQQVAKAVVKANDADLSPPAEFQASTSEKRDKRAKEELGYVVGTQAYLYGAASERYQSFRYGIGQLAKLSKRFNPDRFSANSHDGVQYNELNFVRKLPDPDLKLGITPNVDTLYGSIFFNLHDEPVVLTIPKIEDRYNSVQLVDHNLSNIGYIGGHRMDWRDGTYLFSGPGWEGEVPPGVRHFPMPTYEGQAAIRILIDGPEDEATVNALQDQYKIATLSRYLDPSLPEQQLEIEKPKEDGTLHEYRLMVEIAQRNPPQTAEGRAIWKSFEYIGLSLDHPFDAESIDPAIRRGMERAIETTQDIVAWNVKYRGYKSKYNWNIDLVGGSYSTDYLKRAEGAIQGYIVHDPIENMYFHTYHDIDGNELTGDEAYIVHFDAAHLPPVKEFWSLTVYGNDYNIVHNPIDRYSISDRTKGLTYNEDGSLTLYLAAEEPVEGQSNWLPIPDGAAFRLNLRMYNPREVMFDPALLEDFVPPVQKR